MKRLVPISCLVLLNACGSGAASDDAGTPPEPVALVRTEAAARGSTGDTIAIYGVAEAGPGNERGMTVQAEAVMDHILAPTGTAVRAGETVAILRPSPTARLDLARSASDASSADAAFARARRLRADGLVSDADVEIARAAAAAADAALAAARQRGVTLVLRAPVAGTVQNLTAKPGDVLAPGTTVAAIGAGGDLRARFGIDPASAVHVRPGQPLQLAAINAATALSTIVSGVDPQVDATTRLAAVFARVSGGQGIGVGEPLRGLIRIDGTATGITIPYAALLDDGGRSYVFVVQGAVAHRRDVSPGSAEGDRIAILRGLAAGERVVTQGGTALEDGMKVTEGDRRPAGGKAR